MTDQHPGDDVLLDLVLTDLDDAQASLVGLHLDGCHACSARCDELAGEMERLLAAAPPVPAPAGFSGQVLEVIAPGAVRRAAPPVTPAAVDEAGEAPEDGSGPPARRRRWPALLAAAALALLAGCLGGILGYSWAGREAAPPVASGPSQLVTADGESVGSASVSRYEGERVLVVRLDRPGSGTSYACRFVLADGAGVPAGTWTWDGSRPVTWIVPVPEGATTLQVVTGSGAVWASGAL